MKVVTSLLTTAATVVKAVVDTAVDVMKKFVDWAIQFVQSTLDTVLGPLINAIKSAVDSYIAGIFEASGKACEDYRLSGKVGGGSISALSAAFSGGLFMIVLAFGIALDVVDLILAPLKLTFGFLMVMLVGLVVALIVEQAFGAVLSEGAQGASSWSWPTILSFARSSGCGPRNSSQSASAEGLAFEQAMAAASVVPGVLSLICGAASIEEYKTKVNGGMKPSPINVPKWGVIAIAFSCVGIAIGFAAVAVEPAATSLFVGACGLVLGIFGATMGFVSAAFGSIGLWDIACLALSALSIYISYKSLVLTSNRV
jgi:hypothetical protein